MKSTIKLVVGILGVFCLGIAIVFWAKLETRQESEKLQELVKPFGTQSTSVDSPPK